MSTASAEAHLGGIEGGHVVATWHYYAADVDRVYCGCGGVIPANGKSEGQVDSSQGAGQKLASLANDL